MKNFAGDFLLFILMFVLTNQFNFQNVFVKDTLSSTNFVWPYKINFKQAYSKNIHGGVKFLSIN